MLSSAADHPDGGHACGNKKAIGHGRNRGKQGDSPSEVKHAGKAALRRHSLAKARAVVGIINGGGAPAGGRRLSLRGGGGDKQPYRNK